MWWEHNLPLSIVKKSSIKEKYIRFLVYAYSKEHDYDSNEEKIKAYRSQEETIFQDQNLFVRYDN